MYTGDYDDMQTPNFGTELPPAAGSSTTSSSNDPQSTPSPNGLVAPLTVGDGDTPEESWTEDISEMSIGTILNPTRSEELAARRARMDSMKSTPDSVQEQKMVKALEKNTQMYICADKLQIDKLMEYAAEKFKKRLWAIADAKNTYPAVRLAFENTRQEDTVLCNEALRYCIHHHQRIEAFPMFLVYLQKCEPSAWTIGVELQRMKDNQQESLGQKLKTLKKEKLRAEIIKAQAEAELNSAVQLVNGTKFMLGERCTNADMKLETHTNNLGTKQYQLTCKCCNKQHQGVYLTVARFE